MLPSLFLLLRTLLLRARHQQRAWSYDRRFSSDSFLLLTETRTYERKSVYLKKNVKINEIKSLKAFLAVHQYQSIIPCGEWHCQSEYCEDRIEFTYFTVRSKSYHGVRNKRNSYIVCILFSIREPDSIQAFLFHGLTLTTSEHCVLNARTIC